jgi:hypothetical protein
LRTEPKLEDTIRPEEKVWDVISSTQNFRAMKIRTKGTGSGKILPRLESTESHCFIADFFTMYRGQKLHKMIMIVMTTALAICEGLNIAGGNLLL